MSGGFALCPLGRYNVHYNPHRTGSTQFPHDQKKVDWDLKNQNKQNQLSTGARDLQILVLRHYCIIDHFSRK